MDTPDLPRRLLLAGRDYQRQLATLGLHPEGLLWALDAAEQEFVLWIIWSGLDRFGPLAISDLLFKAYRASALTQEIDPFMVDLRSPRDLAGSGVLDSLRNPPPGSNPKGPFILTHMQDGELAYVFKSEWIYNISPKRLPTLTVNRDWRRFNANVAKLAA